MPNNPPAFPAEVSNDGYIQTGPNTAKYSGMTLLDYFAGQALAGAFASQWFSDHCSDKDAQGGDMHDALARNCYRSAQAMLTERARRGGDDE